MPTKTKAIVSLWILLIALCCGLPVQASSAGKNPCTGCHGELGRPSKNEHPAVNLGCETCHVKVQGMEHPQQKESMKLIMNVPELCYHCHKKSKFEGKDIHAPVAAGNCTGCHNPHRSDFGKLLLNDPPELCYICHDKAKFTKKYVHKIITRRCSCHNQHASEGPYLLYAGVNTVCTDCHRIRQSGRHVVSSLPRGKVHPVEGVPDPSNRKKKITCASCHNPHSSDYPKLFPKARICRTCHKYY